MDNLGNVSAGVNNAQLGVGANAGVTSGVGVQTLFNPNLFQSQQVQNNMQSSSSQTEPEPKVFTQEQLDSIISSKVNKINREKQELLARLSQSEQLSQSYLNELNGFKQKDMTRRLGVPDKFLDFAVFEANKLAVNGKTFDVAVQEYVTANSQLFGISNTGSQAQLTATPAGNGATQGVVNPTQATQTQTVTQTAIPPVTAQGVVNTQQSAPATVNVGQTGAANVGGAISQTDNIDAEVEEFLKKKHKK